MRPDPIRAIASALESQRSGIVIVYYPDFGLRDAIVDEVESVAGPGVANRRVSQVAAALDHPHELVLLVPEAEAEAVEELEGVRDQFLTPERTQPVVLFLLRGGAGEQQLRSAPGLASWVAGNAPDPEELAAVDPAAERDRFRLAAGAPADEWLRRWRGGEIEKTATNISLAYWAFALERP